MPNQQFLKQKKNTAYIKHKLIIPKYTAYPIDFHCHHQQKQHNKILHQIKQLSELDQNDKT